MSTHINVIEMQDKVGLAADQARAVVISLSKDANFDGMQVADIECCLSIILEKLDIIREEVDRPTSRFYMTA